MPSGTDAAPNAVSEVPLVTGGARSATEEPSGDAALAPPPPVTICCAACCCGGVPPLPLDPDCFRAAEGTGVAVGAGAGEVTGGRRRADPLLPESREVTTTEGRTRDLAAGERSAPLPSRGRGPGAGNQHTI